MPKILLVCPYYQKLFPYVKGVGNRNITKPKDAIKNDMKETDCISWGLPSIARTLFLPTILI